MRVRKCKREIVTGCEIRRHVRLFHPECSEDSQQEVSQERGEDQNSRIDPRRHARSSQCDSGVADAHI